MSNLILNPQEFPFVYLKISISVVLEKHLQMLIKEKAPFNSETTATHWEKLKNISFELWWPLHGLLYINQESIEIQNWQTMLLEKYSDLSFPALISRYWKFITLSKPKHFLFAIFSGQWLLAGCFIFITVSQLHNLMDLRRSKINSLKPKAWTVSFFITSNQGKIKIIPCSRVHCQENHPVLYKLGKNLTRHHSTWNPKTYSSWR